MTNGNKKGKLGERQCATDIREAFPELADSVRRGWQARDGADDPDVIGLPRLWLESKKGRKPNPRAALEQAAEAVKGRDYFPLAVIRGDRKKPFMVMFWSDFLEVIRPFVIQETKKHHVKKRDILREGRERQDVRANSEGGRTWRVRL